MVAALFQRARAHEQPGATAGHDLDQLLVDRVLGALAARDQLLELFLPLRARSRLRFEGRGYRRAVLDVVAQRLLVRPDGVQATVEAVGQPAELLLCEPPCFSSKFRWSDVRTSANAAAIRTPGGWSGPP